MTSSKIKVLIKSSIVYNYGIQESSTLKRSQVCLKRRLVRKFPQYVIKLKMNPTQQSDNNKLV